MAWWESRIHPDDRERVVEELWDHLSSGRRFYTREYRFRTADGSYATVFDRGHVAFGEDGRPTRVVGTLIDLTERRRHQENRRLLAQTGMILHLSLDYEATLPGIAQLLVHGFAGCALLHIGPHHGAPAFLTAAHADPRQQATLEGLGPLLDGGPPPGSPIARVMRTAESLLITEFDPGVLSDESLPPELRAVLSDLDPESAMVVAITARQAGLGFLALARFRGAPRFDADDLHVAEELARRIGIAVDHARLVHSAALANRAKSDFLAVVNHELRTPLTAVQGYADLLAAEIAGPLTEDQKRQVAGIRSGSDRLLRLIEGILLFARLETGDERPHFDRVALGPLLEQVAALVRPQAAEKGLEFRLEVGDLPAVCCTDTNKLLQILLSLLTNAIKFSERGAVTLSAAARDDQVVFDVADTGTGIAEEHLPHVFNAFWQAEQPATRRAGGAGLGLSVARRLARLLDGDVFAAATSPRGTTFRVLLPVTRNP
jgi:signal transduction histidine kinase